MGQKLGGGENHRFIWYDYAKRQPFCRRNSGYIQTKTYLKEKQLDLKIIVEARDLNEVK
jgi:nicotinate-nucleotide pyrophosphorylase (carboxylating)